MRLFGLIFFHQASKIIVERLTPNTNNVYAVSTSVPSLWPAESYGGDWCSGESDEAAGERACERAGRRVDGLLRQRQLLLRNEGGWIREPSEITLWYKHWNTDADSRGFGRSAHGRSCATLRSICSDPFFDRFYASVAVLRLNQKRQQTLFFVREHWFIDELWEISSCHPLAVGKSWFGISN